ncbi:MAG: Curli production assembly/transport component CsgG [Gelidibacter sp.]
MIAKSLSIRTLPLMLLLVFTANALAQDHADIDKSTPSQHLNFYQYRGTNVVTAVVGTSIMNGDLENPQFEIYSAIGYKRYIIPYLNVCFSYNKFNLAYKDIYNEGFMSFDLNMESTLFPDKKCSPFIFAGGGYNASNYFKQTAMKVQGGGGLEYIITDGFGIKLQMDYNYVFSDELDGKVFGASNDVYWRLAFGVNFYFGGQDRKEKLLKGQPTIINSNPIIPHN